MLPVRVSLSSGLRRSSQLLSGALTVRHSTTSLVCNATFGTLSPQRAARPWSTGSNSGPTGIGPRCSLSSAPELTHQRVKGRRRFYKEVTVREKGGGVEGEQGVGVADGGWEVLLDSRVLKTPARQPLEFDSPELAMAVAAEWDAQTTDKGLEPAVMPLMSLACTAIDQVAADRERTIATCLKYLPTDTVCFESPDPDPVIARRQRQLWTPLREWSAETLGIQVETTSEIHLRPQHPPEASRRARELLESFDEMTLAAVQSVTMECKSLLIALALVFRKMTVEKAFEAARLEEEYNVERWGMIEGGHDMDRANTTLTLTAASTLLWLRSGGLPKSTQ